MKRISKISLVLLVGLFANVSCNELVNTNPQYTLDADNFFNAPADYDKALTASYDLLQTSFVTLWVGEIASDNAIAGGESVTDTEGLHQIDAMSHGGVNNELRNIWRWMYAGITRVNYMYEFKDKIEFEGKEDMYAQAAFLRAYYYFNLVKFFGDVPMVLDKRIAISDVAKLPRMAKADVYAQIEKDLKTASATLSWTAAQKGRITKGAALALLGKVYLYEEKFDDAAVSLDSVINHGTYSLFADVGSLFRVVNEGNPETVFDVEYVGIEGGSYGCLVCLEGNAAVGFQGIRGYVGPVYGDGNSYNLPTQNLVDEYEANDPRLDAYILDIEKFKAQHHDSVVYTIGAGGHTGYYNNKYLKRAAELGAPDTDLTSPVNNKVIRFAHVLLWAAEANNRKSAPDDGKALGYLNQVRARVSMTAASSAGSALTDAIYHEERVEFAGEGERFFDLVRTGRAAAAIEGFTTNKNELFPIPQIEIDLAGAGWAQNTGY